MIREIKIIQRPNYFESKTLFDQCQNFVKDQTVLP
jgi:hypothetical protein